MSGGGGGGTTESTSYQTNLPEYAEPYYKELMARTQEESIQPFTPYEGERVAGFSAAQQQAQEGIMGLQAPTSLGEAESTMREVGQSALEQSYTPTQFGTDYQASPYQSGYAPGQITSGYQAGVAPEAYTAGQITSPYQAGQFDAGYQASQITPGYEAGTFDAAAAEQYMDPYMRQVLDTQKREAAQEYARSRAGTAAEAVQAGAFGGSRFGVREAEMESEYLDRLADIEAQGMQTAYQQAREQFGAEQAMQQQAGQMGLTAQQASESARQTWLSRSRRVRRLPISSLLSMAKRVYRRRFALLRLSRVSGRQSSSLSRLGFRPSRRSAKNSSKWRRQNLTKNIKTLLTPETMSASSLRSTTRCFGVSRCLFSRRRFKLVRALALVVRSQVLALPGLVLTTRWVAGAKV